MTILITFLAMAYTLCIVIQLIKGWRTPYAFFYLGVGVGTSFMALVYGGYSFFMDIAKSSPPFGAIAILAIVGVTMAAIFKIVGLMNKPYQKPKWFDGFEKSSNKEQDYHDKR